MQIPAEIIVFFAAMLPLLEINGSIPLGSLLGLPSAASLFWSMLGITTASLIVFKIIDPIVKFIFEHVAFLKKHVQKHFDKLHTKHSKRFNEIGIIFLCLFVIIPLPVSGSYTAIAVAYIFNAPFWPAMLAILLGNLVKGLFFTGGVETVLFFLRLA